MPTPEQAVPLYIQMGLLWRWPVARYHQLLRAGFPEVIDRFELLEGLLIRKQHLTPAVEDARRRLRDRLANARPHGWQARVASAITLADSEPMPDAVLARGDEDTFAHGHPGPADIGRVVEVADTSLTVDRTDMGRIYARANLPVYWVINVVDRQLEVYTDPRSADPVPAYATRTDYRPGDAVPLLLDGRPVAQLPVDELLG